MAGTWDLVEYRQKAKRWRAHAAGLNPGPTQTPTLRPQLVRRTWLSWWTRDRSDHYVRLASWSDARTWTFFTTTWQLCDPLDEYVPERVGTRSWTTLMTFGPGRTLSLAGLALERSASERSGGRNCGDARTASVSYET
jgi:hypothetical protein